MRSREKLQRLSHISQYLETMRKVLLRIEDGAFEKFMGMVSLCPQIEVIDTGGKEDYQDETILWMSMAIKELRERRVMRMPRDYTYIMMALNEGVIDGVPYFYTPKDFLDYLSDMGFDCLPSKTTLYDTMNSTMGRYPKWKYADNPKDTEALRRNNIIVQLLSAYGRAKRRMSE